MPKRNSVISPLLVLLAWTPLAFCQLTTATFYAIATDSSGALVPGATVTLTHNGTGTVTTKKTNSSGEAAFDFLRVGSYTLTIESQGFKKYQSTGLELRAGENVRRTFALELGNVSETVNVEATAPLVNTVDAHQQENFSRTQVTELPMARRNYSNLLALETGATSATTSGNSVRMNGLGKSGTNITVDGADATGNPEARMTSMYQGFNYIDTISIEAVDSVQTVKGIVPAEYGQTLGGYVNLITKSGTNQFHGSLFENFQSQDLNGRNQFLRTRTPLTFNQFGGSAGGPIRKDKIFIFGAYEGYRESAFVQVNGNVPTQLFRDQLLLAQPNYKLVLGNMPLPNQAVAPGANVGFFLGASASRAHENHAVIKGDVRLTDSSSLALTYTRMRPFKLQPSFYIGNDRTSSGYEDRGAVSYVTGRAAWTSETRFGYNLTSMDRVDAFWNALDPNHPERALGGARVPQIKGPGFSSADSEYFHLGGPIWTLEEKYALVKGVHSLKFGGKWSKRGGGRFDIANSVEQYSNNATLLANSPDSITVNFGNNPFTYRMFELGFFAQDDWRISSKLVVNMGIRYDYFSNFVAKPSTDAPAGFFNLDGLLDSKFHFGPFRDTSDPFNSDPGINLGPRLGFAYNPDATAKTVIRGGFGIMFSPLIPMNFTRAVAASKSIPFRSNYSKTEAANYGLIFPVYNQDVTPIINATGQVQVATLVKPTIQAPYSMNLYLGVQRALSSSWMLESAFVGNRGVKLTMLRNFNLVDRVTGVRPNPALGSGDYVDDSQNSVYYSWQTSLRKRYSNHLTADIHYTWGKGLSYTGGDLGAAATGDALTTVQDFFNWRAERSPSSGDITHSFAASAIYELPLFSSLNGFTRSVIGGWQVSSVFTAATGLGLLLSENSGISPSRPDYIGGDAVTGNYSGTLQYLDPKAFARVPISSVTGGTIRPGNVGNGEIRGPGRWNVDLSLAKNFHLFKERLVFQFRADSFNVFNHTNFTTVDTEITRNTFGRLLATAGARVIQLNARLSW